jgi:hypothetical protein
MSFRQLSKHGLVIGFFVRHFLALLALVIAACVMWTVIYAALLLWAMVWGGGIGGPLAYPAGLLIVAVASTLAAFILLLPSTALAELLTRRLKLPILAQIPISAAFLALLCMVGAGVVQAVPLQDATPKGFFTVFGLAFAIHLLPLCLYWWVAQSGPLMLSIIRWLNRAKNP